MKALSLNSSMSFYGRGSMFENFIEISNYTKVYYNACLESLFRQNDKCLIDY